MYEIFFPSRRDQNNYLGKNIFDHGTLETIIRHPLTTVNPQQPQLQVTVLRQAYHVMHVVCNFLDETTGKTDLHLLEIRL